MSLPLIAGGLQVASSIGGLLSSSSRNRARRRANRASARIEKLRAQRQRMLQQRALRIQRAQVEAGAASGTSTLMSSGVQGALGSVQSRGNAAMGFAGAIDANNEIRIAAGKKIEKLNQRDAIIGGIGNLAGTISTVDSGLQQQGSSLAGELGRIFG